MRAPVETRRHSARGRQPTRAIGGLTAALFAVLTLDGCSGGGPGPDASGTSSAATAPAATGQPIGPAPTTSSAVASPRISSTVTTGLTSPWGLAFLPDGSALVSERDTARIKQIPAGDDTARVLGTVPGVVHNGEGGLLGIAVSAGFGTDRWLYAYLTAAEGNRVVRLRLGTDGRLGPVQSLLTGIPAARNHNGGRLAFGPDGMLYVSTGDALVPSRAQDVRSLAGKILRVTPTGAPAPGNPFAGSPVYSYGHRNVQGLAFDAQGRLWASEFGNRTWDELNLVQAGANYGWPLVEGRAGRAGLVDPVLQWRTSEASPSGMAVAAGSVWLAALRGARLWQVPLVNDDGVGPARDWFTGELGRLRTVMTAPDGSLWLMTNNTDGRGNPRSGDDRILRLTLSS